ncbi:putative membrane protein [Halomicrobium sp. LC1Hm]|nr:putative membrane protein [Halomicrobium sp. LC1Hm]
MASDYMNIRSLPAMLSVGFILASLYQFGGIGTVELVWFNYTLTGEHAIMVSLGAFAAAFASSETKRFEDYETWEQVAIAAGPGVILGQQYVTEVNDFLVSLGDPVGMQLAFVATVVSWGVAVQ